MKTTWLWALFAALLALCTLSAARLGAPTEADGFPALCDRVTVRLLEEPLSRAVFGMDETAARQVIAGLGGGETAL